MKKFTISTFLRPAILKDVFDNEGKGKFYSGKQFFYKNADGSISGPYRVQESIAILLQDYEQYFQLLSDQRLFVADKHEFSNSFEVHIKVKQVEEHDIIEGTRLIANTTYFKYLNDEMLGPFLIKDTDPKHLYYTIIANKNMFVFDKAAVITIVEKKVNQLIS